jgi:UPF0716 protein FxsA
MPLLLVVAFVVVLLVELVVILQIGQVIGTWPTVALLVADSVLGAWLLKREGRRAWHQFRAALDEMRWPGDEVAQGAMVIVGGTLLLTPGFVTDVVGFLLLLPPSRRMLSRLVRRRMSPLGGAGSDGPREAGPRRRAGGGNVYDVEVVDIERDDPPPPRNLPGGEDGPAHPG